MRIENRTKTIIAAVYVANDGTEFESKVECLEYEEQSAECWRREIEHLRIVDAEGYLPYNEYTSEDNNYNWYHLYNGEEKKKVEKAFGIKFECADYPNIICVEEVGNDVYYYLMSQQIYNLNRWLNKLGYEVVRKK